ncbi:ATP-binding cassette domain-containing protein [Pseudomaricurvus sp. HS19]|uniref:phosphatase domain-containing putative toxin n=1 Tax=Pseudomaricurvus sp. HS19 TaxID=2692626 RepID=UPI00136B761C|nr:ATP-binding cassette domain-containing protein [Pseudomaricurvus sp. HS19]MYM65101.1 ATP-binding cassette domain-containing protein [Pseudomaricurvus sp. HS19]
MDNSGAILSLAGFGLSMLERVILADVNLTITEPGITCLAGPAGTGKSTLLRTLAGFNASNPNIQTWGEARYCGAPLGAGDSPAMVMQSARLLTSNILQNVLYDLPEKGTLGLGDQRDLAVRLLEDAGLQSLVDKLYRPVQELDFADSRYLSIVRICASNPRMICLDEPTTGLSEGDSERLLEYIRCQGSKRAVLITLHNQAQMMALGGNTALMTGGVLKEMVPTSQFFAAPSTDDARTFVRTGSCPSPSPGKVQEHPDDELPDEVITPKPAPAWKSESFGPRDFLWLHRGQLAGTPRPGVFHETSYDLAALKRVGITCLLSLTELPPNEPAIETDLLAEFGIRHGQYPIPDMCAPSVDLATTICSKIDELISAGEVVAVHCRAGLGRTGTVLTAYLIWQGVDAITALETARKIEPRWVQSREQVNFLEQFCQHVRGEELEHA